MIQFVPTPSPSPSSDPCGQGAEPFGPLPVQCAPPAPEWLFPVTMTLLAIALVVAVVLVIMWVVSARRDKAALRARLRERGWVDLNEFDPRKDTRRDRSPKVVRERSDNDEPPEDQESQ